MLKAAEAVQELDGSGLSLIEISHRSKAFVDIMEGARNLAIELLGLKIKDIVRYFFRWCQSSQFLMTAYNLLEKEAGYINTGTWSLKAIKARLFGKVTEVASSQEANFNYIPKKYDIPNELRLSSYYVE